MHTYAAQLGHLPSLSLAELRAAFPDIDRVSFPREGYAVFSMKTDISQSDLNRLGGTVTIAKRLSQDSLSIDDIPTLLLKELEGRKGKVTFSLRTSGLPRGDVKALYRTCKEHLKSMGMSVRYIGNERDSALPIQLHQEHLLDGEKGCELMILRDNKDLWIGRTVAAQDSAAYTKRDMNKPVRDTTVGLLPPKLAQILLTFGTSLVREMRGAVPETLTILDPFCGSGVIPLEAMLRGYHVLASDNAQKAVQGCAKNVEWLRKEEGIKKSDVSVEIAKHDARKPFSFKNPPDVIVSETSLGPNLKARPSVAQAEKICKECEALQDAFLRNVAATLPGVPLVLTWPVWYTKKRPVHLSKTEKTCADLGYEFTLPPDTSSVTPARPSLLYRRKDQFVGREIVLLVPRRP